MKSNPRKGQRVLLWYRKDKCHLFPLYGMGIELDGEIVREWPTSLRL